jgi:hypothetical protein
MPQLTFEEAAQRLRALGGMERLLEAGPWISPSDLVDLLKGTPLEAARTTLIRWLDDLPGTVEVEGLGLRAKRDEVIIMLASKIRQRNTDTA